MDSRVALRKVAVFALALMVVSSVAISGVGPVDDDFSPVEEAEAFALSATILIGAGVSVAAGSVATCYITDCHVTEEDIEEIQEDEAAQQEADLAASVKSKRDSSQRFRTGIHNFLQDGRTMASIHAKTEIVRMVNNGTTDPSTIENAVNDTIADYYAVRERNLISQYNSHIYQTQYVVNSSHNDSGVSNHVAYISNETTDAHPSTNYDPAVLWNISLHQQRNYTLTNGTNVSAAYLGVTYDDYFTNSGGHHNYNYTYYGLHHTNLTGPGGETAIDRPVRVSNVSHPDVDRNVSGAEVLNVTAYENNLDEIENASTAMQANYDESFVSTVTGAYAAGDINVSEVLNPEILAGSYAADYNQTGDSIYKWANLAMLGLDSPDLENVSYMNVSYNKPVNLTHVTLDFSGTPGSSEYTLSVLGPEVGSRSWTVDGAESIRIPAPREAIITISNGSSSASFDARPNVVTRYAEDGESITVDGLTATVTEVSATDRRTDAGMLFARDAPDGGFNVSETYNASNMSTAVFFSPKSRDGGVLRITGEFSIVSAVNDAGENVSVVDTESYNYQTKNASALIEQLKQIEDFRETVENATDDPTSGGLSGGFLSDFGLPSNPGAQLIILLIGGLAAASVLRRP